MSHARSRVAGAWASLAGRPRAAALSGLLLGALTLQPALASGQTAVADNQLRIGVTFGSTSFLGIAVEYFWDERRSIDLGFGSWGLRDVSVSIVAKQYVGGDDNVRAFAGLGLWNVTAWQEEGVGTALILRAPIGGELGGRNAVGAELSLSRAVLIRRADPEDLRPPRDRIVPLPGFYYRWATR